MQKWIKVEMDTLRPAIWTEAYNARTLLGACSFGIC